MGRHSKVDDTQEIPVVADNPTQVDHKWKATTRTVFQVIVGLAAVAPFVVPIVGLSPAVGVGAGILAVSAAITRLMSEPRINAMIDRFLPWLRAR